jgi:hypothetical protein
MEELQIVNLENTDISKWNFEQIRSQLEKGLSNYKGVVYTDDSIKTAKEDRSELNRAKKNNRFGKKDL